MKRRLFKLVAVISLLLCAATVALWVRSYSRYDALRDIRSRNETSQWLELRSLLGHIEVMSHREPLQLHALAPLSDSGCFYESGNVGHIGSTRDGTQFRVGVGRRKGSSESSSHLLGFGYRITQSGRESLIAIWFPHWFLALLFAIVPALSVRDAIRSHRLHRAGGCPTCGYDLRATPERCPECGAVPAVK